jgi:hypothetical protein
VLPPGTAVRFVDWQFLKRDIGSTRPFAVLAEYPVVFVKLASFKTLYPAPADSVTAIAFRTIDQLFPAPQLRHHDRTDKEHQYQTQVGQALLLLLPEIGSQLVVLQHLPDSN